LAQAPGPKLSAMVAALANGSGTPAHASYVQPLVSLQAHEMEHIRNVFDEDVKGKKFSCIASPREDAQMFRNTERLATPCECVVELYELLWRWSHRNTKRPDFYQNFGFSVPETIVIVKGRPYAWYFVSKKDGALLRKTESHLTLGQVEKVLCRERNAGESSICATWLPMASQFPEARCHVPYAEFLSPTSCSHFLAGLPMGRHSGIIQKFVDPHGVSNFLVRTVQYKDQTSLCVRTNRSVLPAAGKGNPFDRCATFEGWPGLSSTSSRYRSHKHPHMEEMILAAGETLNQRIEQERVRQMLFLGATEHIALHFKVTKEHQLFFVYASVVPEKDVILQTRPQLLMGDPCMTDALPGAALLAGGTDMKAIPYRGYAPGSLSARDMSCDQVDEDEMDAADRDYQLLLRCQRGDVELGRNDGSLPPLRGRNDAPDLLESDSLRRRNRSERKRMEEQNIAQFFPRVAYPRPPLPAPPFEIRDPPREEDSLGRPSCSLDSLKRPLIFPVSARSIISPPSARSMAEATARSEPGGYGGSSGRPPPSDSWGGGPS